MTFHTIGLCRRRVLYLAVIGILVALGLPARIVPELLPEFYVAYVGDGLWALALFLVLGVMLPCLETRKLALFALSIAYGIELSQLYQADWINAIRSIPPVGIILGYGFLWSDIISYSVGIAVGIILEKRVLWPRSQT